MTRRTMQVLLPLIAWLSASTAFGCAARADPGDPGDDEARDAPVVVAYLPDYRLDAKQTGELWVGPVTDLIYFSVEIPEAGVIAADAVSDERLKRLKAMQAGSGRRLLLCVGGWSRSDGFAAATAGQAKRRALIDSLLKLCKQHGFDGVDYDWEFPDKGEQSRAYSALLIETAERFREAGLLVTVAQHGAQDLGRRAYQAIDRVHLMCYDQGFPHATMDHARQEVRQLIGRGCPPEKIALGVPFYGRNKARRALPYARLVQGKDVPATANEIDGYAFNGPGLVRRKARFAVEQGLAGVMVWELTQDEPTRQPLLRAVAAGLSDDKP